MFKILSFRSDGAFWPMAERSELERSHGANTLRGKLLAFGQRLRSDRAARQAMHELASLDDRTLRDIGITREQIWHAVRYGRDGALDIARWS